jgi:hypothetical protein
MPLSIYCVSVSGSFFVSFCHVAVMTVKFWASLAGEVLGSIFFSSRQCKLNPVLIELVDQIKITLLLKIQWKQDHILCVKIVDKHNMMH